MKRWLKFLPAILLSLLCSSAAFAQGSFYANIAWRYTPAGAFPAGNATVTVCTSTAIGAPCTPKVSLFQDVALSIPVANPLARCTSFPQVGCIDDLGNFSFYIASGAYSYSISGAGLRPYGPIPIAFQGGGGGGGGNPNLAVTFSNVTSITLNASSLNTTSLLFQCYDSGNPNANTIEANASLNLSTLVITFGFTVPQSGYCAVNGSGGGGSGPSVGAVLLSPIINQSIVQPVSTTLSVNSLNNVYNATMGSGGDIGAKINSLNAVANTATSGGTIFVPDGAYSFSTTIAPVLVNNKGLTIQCASPATVLNYTGSGDAIYVNNTLSQFANLTILNCTLNGSGAGGTANGLHNQKTGGGTFTNLHIKNFGGMCVYNQGAVAPHFTDLNCVQNGYSMVNTPDTASSVSTNALVVDGASLFQFATTTNYWEEPQAGLRDQQNSIHVTMEESVRVPNAIIEACDTCSLSGYIEYLGAPTGSLLPSVIIGNETGSGFGSNSAQTVKQFNFQNTHELSATTGASLEIYNAQGVLITGNDEQGSNSYYIAFGASPSIGISGVNVMGNLSNNLVANFLNSVASYFVYNDIGPVNLPAGVSSTASGSNPALLDSQTTTAQIFGHYKNTSGEMYWGIDNSAGTAFSSSLCAYCSVFYSPSNNSFFVTPLITFTGNAAVDGTLTQNSGQTVTSTIAKGTAAMTTALIAGGACGTTVTVTATGALTTDTIEFANNAAVVANPGVLNINRWPTAGNVNFNYCNPTAGNVTPSAATLNWSVTR